MQKRISSIDVLRGIAALSVCIFHFTNGNQSYLSGHYWLKQIGSVGWAGVEIFFVISGFIIPYSLYTAKYELKKFGNFLLKRVVRIEPPYFFSIILVVIFNYLSTLSPYFKGEAFSINYFNLALHIGYLNDFFQRPWANPVLWTLAIEFQFYLLIGLFFPLINHKKTWISIIAITLLLCCSFLIKESTTIFYYLLYFILGILVFKRKTNMHYNKLIIILEVLVLMTIFAKFSMIPFVATVFAWVILSFFENWKNKWLLWLGMISYSLYLTHVPVGGRIINLSASFLKTDLTRSFGVLFAIFFSLIFAYFFYKLVELPSMQFSRSLFKNKNAS